MSLPALSARVVNHLRFAIPKTVSLDGRPHSISSAVVVGPHQPARSIASVFTETFELAPGRRITGVGDSRIFEIVSLDTGGIPVIASQGLIKVEFENSGNRWRAMQDPLDKERGVLHLTVEIPDYFGIIQDTTRAVIEMGLETISLRAADEKLTGIAHQLLEVRQKPDDPRSLCQILKEFETALTTRIRTSQELRNEGERPLFVYRELIDSAAKFSETFPSGLNQEGIELALKNHPAVTEALLKYLRIKFDRVYANYYGLDKCSLPSVEQGIQNDITKCLDPDKKALEFLLNFVLAVEETNAFDYNRDLDIVVFRFNNRQVQGLVKELNISLPEDIIYVYNAETGSTAISARYGGKVSKGGIRYYPPTAKDYPQVLARSLGETLRLAWTQERKNALWSCFVNGSKTVLVSAPLLANGKTSAELKELFAKLKRGGDLSKNLPGNERSGSHI